MGLEEVGEGGGRPEWEDEGARMRVEELEEVESWEGREVGPSSSNMSLLRNMAEEVEGEERGNQYERGVEVIQAVRIQQRGCRRMH